ncbi:MAG: multiprotein bridging factor aMBF1 [Candidatus Micrarchaeia archaeon]
MEECELCGKKTDVVYIAEVEGVEFRLCAACANGKKVIKTERVEPKTTIKANQKTKATTKTFEKRISREDMELIDNYSETIRKARENMKLPIPVLAEMISEKEHLLMKIEEGKAVPPLKLIDKLEKTLRIKLLKPPENLDQSNFKNTNENITIGDLTGDNIRS